MNIQRLVLQDFRNVHACDLSPGKGINIFCGENGQGKTNLLEAIYLLSNLSPIRPAPLKNLILFGSDYGRIFGRVWAGGTQKDLSVFLRNRSKVVKVNGKSISRGVDYFGELAVILFSPETLKLVQAGPEARRRFMDTAISRLDRRYLLDLKEYKQILEQRNRLLRLAQGGRMGKKALSAWNEQLASTGSRILQKRTQYLTDFAPTSAGVFENLFRKKQALRIVYRSSLYRRFRQEVQIEPLPLLRERFLEGIALSEKEEARLGVTQLGPHLDDLVFEVAGRPAKPFVSQGEGRILALSLSIGEAILYRKKKGVFPVLLLDDITSELDRRHQEVLGEHLLRLGQVFLTTSHDGITLKTLQCPSVFRVQKGEIVLEKKGGKM